MHITSVTYMKRKTLAQYEHHECTVTVAVDAEESKEVAVQLATETVNSALGLSNLESNTKVASGKKSTNAKPVKKEEPAKKTAKAKSKPAKDLSIDDVTASLRDYAKAKNSKEMAVEIMSNVTGTKSLKEVDKKFYSKLVKALAI